MPENKVFRLLKIYKFGSGWCQVGAMGSASLLDGGWCGVFFESKVPQFSILFFFEGIGSLPSFTKNIKPTNI